MASRELATGPAFKQCASHPSKKAKLFCPTCGDEICLECLGAPKHRTHARPVLIKDLLIQQGGKSGLDLDDVLRQEEALIDRKSTLQYEHDRTKRIAARYFDFVAQAVESQRNKVNRELGVMLQGSLLQIDKRLDELDKVKAHISPGDASRQKPTTALTAKTTTSQDDELTAPFSDFAFISPTPVHDLVHIFDGAIAIRLPHDADRSANNASFNIEQARAMYAANEQKKREVAQKKTQDLDEMRAQMDRAAKERVEKAEREKKEKLDGAARFELARVAEMKRAAAQQAAQHSEVDDTELWQEFGGKCSAHWGSRGSADGQFLGAYAICFREDSSGNILVADFDNHRVQEFTQSGSFVRSFGGELLVQPTSVIINSKTGDTYVAQTGGAVHVFNSQGDFLHVLPVPNTSTSNARDVAVKRTTGHLYILDYDNRVSGCTPDAASYATRNKKATTSTCMSIQGPPAGPTVGWWGVAIDTEAQRLVVSDWGQHRIEVRSLQSLNPAPAASTSASSASLNTLPAPKPLISMGDHGSDPGQLLNPHLVCVHPKTGDVIVADHGNKRVSVWRRDGKFAGVIPCPAWPYGVAVNKDGNSLAISFDSHVALLPYPFN